MTLFSALDARSFKRVIRLFLYLLILNYQNLKTVSVFYVSIKLFHYRILILIRLFYPEILLLMELFYSGILILIRFSQILN